MTYYSITTPGSRSPDSETAKAGVGSVQYRLVDAATYLAKPRYQLIARATYLAKPRFKDSAQFWLRSVWSLKRPIYASLRFADSADSGQASVGRSDGLSRGHGEHGGIFI